MEVFSHFGDDSLLSEFNIVGTHDSATAFVNYENLSRCQDKTVAEQLSMGVRLLDIRLGKKGDNFYLVHAVANCYTDSAKTKRLDFGEILSLCKQFLSENPGETLILSIKQDRGIQNKKFFEHFYNKYIKGEENLWYLKNDIPTLGCCRGKMVLMRRCKIKKSFGKRLSCGLDFSYWKDQKKDKGKGALEINLNETQSAFVQDRYALEKNEKWSVSAKPFLDSCKTDKNTIAVHFLSTSIREETLVPVAEFINGKFMEYEMPKERALGWIFVDFPTRELCDKIINSNSWIYKGEEV